MLDDPVDEHDEVHADHVKMKIPPAHSSAFVSPLPVRILEV
jgi:hypothetical protein